MQEVTPITNQRRHLRQKVQTVAYVNLEADMGGIILDISEAGMGIQAVAPIEAKRILRFDLGLTGTDARIEGTSRVAWSNPGGQAGLHFLDLSEEARRKLKDWLLLNALTSWNPPAPPKPEPRDPKPAAVRAAVAPMLRESPVPQSAPAVLPFPPPKPKSKAAESRRSAAAKALQSGKLMGPYTLNRATLEAKIPSNTPGIFLLGDSQNHTFSVEKVCRSDDMKGSAGDYLGKYGSFQFIYCGTEHDAFEKECHIYHQFRPKDNKWHPTRRYGTDWDCPICHGFS